MRDSAEPTLHEHPAPKSRTRFIPMVALRLSQCRSRRSGWVRDYLEEYADREISLE